MPETNVSLDQLRRDAKRLLAAARAEEPDAVARIHAITAEARTWQLSDAQLAIAREHD